MQGYRLKSPRMTFVQKFPNFSLHPIIALDVWLSRTLAVKKDSCNKDVKSRSISEIMLI